MPVAARWHRAEEQSPRRGDARAHHDPRRLGDQAASALRRAAAQVGQVKPATRTGHLASDTIPAVAERKMRLAATMPSKSALREHRADPELGEDQRREQREHGETPTR